jgi:hypothetical protein
LLGKAVAALGWLVCEVFGCLVGVLLKGNGTGVVPGTGTLIGALVGISVVGNVVEGALDGAVVTTFCGF